MKTRLFFSLLCAGLLSTFFSCSSDDEPAVPTERPEPTLNASDSLALVDIYKAADGDNWYVPWDLTDWRTWGGAGAVYDSVNNEYRVVQIIINQNSPSTPHGYISDRVCDLPYLMRLWGGGKNLTFKIPDRIAELKYLTEVWITVPIKTELSGAIFKCPSLEYLNISNSDLYGELPEEIAEWDNPEARCFLQVNKLTGKVPSGIKIKLLDLKYNEYTKYPFEYCFADFPAIIMDYNPIYDTIPDEVLNDLEALKRLRGRCYKEFTNEPDWWDDGVLFVPGPDDEEEETSSAATTRMMSAPLKTRIEILDDVKLPGR